MSAGTLIVQRTARPVAVPSVIGNRTFTAEQLPESVLSVRANSQVRSGGTREEETAQLPEASAADSDAVSAPTTETKIPVVFSIDASYMI